MTFFSVLVDNQFFTGKVRKRMDRNEPKQTLYEGENVIKLIMSKFHTIDLILSAFIMEIYFVQ